MATYYVQLVADRDNRKNAWEVAKKHGRGTRRISDHRKKKRAVNAAHREANKGDKIGIKNVNGQFLRWDTAGTHR